MDISNHNTKATFLVGGDFNAGDIDWDSLAVKPSSHQKGISDRIISLLCDTHLTQLQREPTRQGKVLELLCTSKPSLLKSIETIPGFSDHDGIIMADFYLSAQINKRPPPHHHHHHPHHPPTPTPTPTPTTPPPPTHTPPPPPHHTTPSRSGHELTGKPCVPPQGTSVTNSWTISHTTTWNRAGKSSSPISRTSWRSMSLRSLSQAASTYLGCRHRLRGWLRRRVSCTRRPRRRDRDGTTTLSLSDPPREPLNRHTGSMSTESSLQASKKVTVNPSGVECCIRT